MSSVAKVAEDLRQGMRSTARVERGRVLSVDTTELTAEVKPFAPKANTYKRVLLNGAKSNDLGFYVIPAVDAVCSILVHDSDNGSAQLLPGCSIDELVIKFADDKMLSIASDGSYVLKGTSFELGNSNLEPALLGDTLVDLMDQFLTAFINHTHISNGPGSATNPTSPPQSADAGIVQSNLTTALSSKLNIE